MVHLLSQHICGHQHHPTGADIETLGILLRILANHRTFGNLTALIDHRLGDTAVTADLHVRQDNAVIDVGVGVYPHIGKQQGVTYHRAGDDTAAGNHGVHGHAAATIIVEHKLRRWQLLLIGPDGPAGVVEVQFRRYTNQLQVGCPESIHRPGIYQSRWG